MAAAIIAATGLQLAGQFMQAQAEKSANKARARALQAQAQRRIDKGTMEANLITSQGGRDQTSLLASRLSSGSSRRAVAESGALEDIANRAKFEADLALEDAQYEAATLREDAGALQAQNKYNDIAALLGGGSTILGNYYQYKVAQNKKGTGVV